MHQRVRNSIVQDVLSPKFDLRPVQLHNNILQDMTSHYLCDDDDDLGFRALHTPSYDEIFCLTLWHNITYASGKCAISVSHQARLW